MSIPWTLVSIAVGVILIVIFGISVLKRKGWKREVDYRSYFNMGIVWLPFGIVVYLIFKNFIGILFSILGLIFLAIGLINKDKWGKPQEVSPKYQKLMMIGIAIGVIVLIIGIIVYEIMA